jgi:hypothetical protein
VSGNPGEEFLACHLRTFARSIARQRSGSRMLT